MGPGSRRWGSQTPAHDMPKVEAAVPEIERVEAADPRSKPADRIGIARASRRQPGGRRVVLV